MKRIPPPEDVTPILWGTGGEMGKLRHVTPTLSPSGVGTPPREPWQIALFPRPTLVSHSCVQSWTSLSQGCTELLGETARQADKDNAQALLAVPVFCPRLNVVLAVTP